MNRIITISLLLVISVLGRAQESEIRWSPFGDKEKKEVEKLATSFISTYLESDFKRCLKYFDKKEINFGGELWLQPDAFLGMIASIRGTEEMQIDEIRAYTMDDIESDAELKSTALKIHRMFSNFSVLVLADLNNTENGKEKTICLNFNIDAKEKWIISCFSDLSIGMAGNTSFPKDRFRIEEFDELDISVPIPKDFLKGTEDGSHTIFILPGTTERDAAIQVDYKDLVAPVAVLSSKWVEYLTSQYEHGDILVKYLPYGYKYEYFVKDENGKINKGITVAFETKGKFVYLQYFSFSETYNSIWIDIDQMFRNIDVN